jgi:hypothetical protein
VLEQFYFDVGQAERHRVDFSFDRMWGKIKITVDGSLVDTDRLLLSFRLTRRFQFNVGQSEQHAVVIEKTRKPLFGGLLPSDYRVWIDGQPAYVMDGGGMRPVGVPPGPPS